MEVKLKFNRLTLDNLPAIDRDVLIVVPAEGRSVATTVCKMITEDTARSDAGDVGVDVLCDNGTFWAYTKPLGVLWDASIQIDESQTAFMIEYDNAMAQ